MAFEVEEKFIPFPYNKHFKVSQYGRVKYKDKILLQTNKDGYLVVEITEKVHRLVALTWQNDKYEELNDKYKELGKNKEERPVVHHINDDKLDNKADNLEWKTDKEHKEIHNIKRMNSKNP